MKVQLVSYRYDQRWKFSNDDQIKMTAEIINASDADLILFCGKSLRNIDDRTILYRKIKNKKVTAVLDGKPKGGGYQIAILQEGKIRILQTPQMFISSSDLSHSLASDYIDVLESERRITVAGKSCLIIQCGEINILKNRQKENNRVEFRFKDDNDLNKRFHDLLRCTEIILNPIHSPMGNQNKMAKRREYLTSEAQKYYFSASTNAWSGRCHYNMQSRILQYTVGTPQPKELDSVFEKYYTIRTFEID